MIFFIFPALIYIIPIAIVVILCIRGVKKHKESYAYQERKLAHDKKKWERMQKCGPDDILVEKYINSPLMEVLNDALKIWEKCIRDSVEKTVNSDFDNDAIINCGIKFTNSAVYVGGRTIDITKFRDTNGDTYVTDKLTDEKIYALFIAFKKKYSSEIGNMLLPYEVDIKIGHKGNVRKSTCVSAISVYYGTIRSKISEFDEDKTAYYYEDGIGLCITSTIENPFSLKQLNI